jgi:hypothetical protein
VGEVYLLHFDTPLAHAKHYLGWAEDAEKRVQKHFEGTSGVKIMDAVHRNRISFTVARVWDGVTRTFERSLKNRGGLGQFCPICRNSGEYVDKYRAYRLRKKREKMYQEQGMGMVASDKTAAANYQDMFTAILKLRPDLKPEVDHEISWAKQNLKKQDRVIWFLRLYRLTLLDSALGVTSSETLKGKEKAIEAQLENLLDAEFGRMQKMVPDFKGTLTLRGD